jgi:multidrug efflux pump
VNFSEIFISRPIATSLLMAAVVMLGMLGYTMLPISALPTVDFPTVQVTTQLPGASPEVMESLVTTPLEQQFGQISGLASMNSNSAYGLSTITLQFVLDRDIDNASQDVQAAINAAKGTLPTTLPYPPVYNKVNPADTPILQLALHSSALPIDQVADFADSVLGQKLSQVSGVGLVSIQGNLRPAVRVQANPARLANLGLALADVRTGLAAANVNSPKGTFDGAQQSFTIGSNDQIVNADDYRPVIIAYKNGAPVRLSDVATVSQGVENEQLAAWVAEPRLAGTACGGPQSPAKDGPAGGCDGDAAAPGAASPTRQDKASSSQTSVLIDVQRQPGANIIQTVDRIKKILPQLTATFPASIKVDILADRTQTIRASVRDVEFTLLLTVALVVMVIFVFLRKLWATVIPSVALPLSIIGTFGMMSLCGFSLDNLSLMALTIATGFVVDDAIVMIENIVRYIEQGEQPEVAARKGARQIGFTVISLTVSLIAVFIPLLFMSGIIGRLFREFALVLSIAVALSAFVSLTLTPMMCAKLLKAENPDEPKSRAFLWSERQFDRILAGYERSLRWVMGRRVATMIVFVITLALTAFLYIIIPKGLLPQQDTGIIVGVAEASQSISFPAMQGRVQALTDMIRQDADVANVSAFVGSGTVNPTLNSGRVNIVLKPRDQRSSSADQIINRLKAQAAGIEGVTLFMQPVQDLQIDSRVSSTQFQYTLQSLDAGDLGEWTPKLLAALQAEPALADVTSDQQQSGLYLRLAINRDRASSLGVSVQSIDDALYDAYGQRQVSTIFTQTNQYRVVLEVPPDFRDNPQALDKLYVKATGNTPVNGTSSSTSLTASASGSGSGSAVASANSAAASGTATTGTTTSTTAATTTSASSGTISATSSTSSTPITTATNASLTTMVPLSAVATATMVNGPLVIGHQAQLPAATISFNLAPGKSLSDALPAIQDAQKRIGMPITITPTFSGAAAEFSSALSSMPLLILAAIIVIYIVLGVLYESYIHPITILSTLPSAGVGALLALLITGQDFSVVALIGIILLIGIVKKNAIMMIDFALEAEREHGKTPEQAIFEAALLRFRPIMMTTMAALLGALPLALESGTGSELRNPLGVSIVGGLILSQLLTLYTTPVIYLYMDRLAQRFRRGKEDPGQTGELFGH